MNNIWILAQTKSNDAPSTVGATKVATDETGTLTRIPSDSNAPPAGPVRKPAGYGSFVLLGLMFVVMYFLLFRGPRRKQQQHKQMVQSLEKNDRVRTIGGIIGTVVDIKGDEITLKVDESNNTKIKVASSAIGKNISKDKS